MLEMMTCGNSKCTFAESIFCSRALFYLYGVIKKVQLIFLASKQINHNLIPKSLCWKHEFLIYAASTASFCACCFPFFASSFVFVLAYWIVLFRRYATSKSECGCSTSQLKTASDFSYLFPYDFFNSSYGSHNKWTFN